jgi:hypothetical protein
MGSTADGTSGAFECRQSGENIRHNAVASGACQWLAIGGYEGNVGPAPVEMLDADGIFRFSQKVIEQAAGEGNCVILGRGSQYFLRNREGTLRFFLYASREQKIDRLVAGGESHSSASSLVDTVDRDRAAFIKRYFHLDWPNRALYHAMINTDIGSERVIRAIRSFIHQSSSTEVAADWAPKRTLYGS